MAEQLVTEHTPMLMNKRFITDAQLSENLNISRRTLQDYRDRGIIPFYRLDGKILYDEADIDKFLSERYRPKYEDRPRYDKGGNRELLLRCRLNLCSQLQPRRTRLNLVRITSISSDMVLSIIFAYSCALWV